MLRLSQIVTLILALLLAFPILADSPIKIICSFSILGDIVKQIAGDHVEVITLVKADTDAHVYQPTPADIKNIADSQLLIINGLGFEGWMERLIQTVNYQGIVVIASQDIIPLKNNGILDPHAWHSLKNAQSYVQTINKALSQIDSAHADYYLENSKNYRALLQKMDEWVRAEFNTIPIEKQKVIASHNSFAYFAEEYGVTFYAAQGWNTEGQASAHTVAQLIKQIRKNQIKALFIENISDPRLMEQIARETQAIMGGKLYSDALSHNETANTYIKLFQHNVQTLKRAMLK